MRFSSLVVEHWTSSILSAGCLRVYGSLPNQSTCALWIWRRHSTVSLVVFCGECSVEYGVRGPLLRAVRSLYDRSRSLVRIAGSKSDLFPVHVGLRQGCPLSPVLFIIFMDRISRRSQGPEGVRFGNHRISSLLFADDVVLLASSSQDLQRVLERFAAECEAAGMRISTSKSEAMVLDTGKGWRALSGVAGRSLRDRVRSSVTREELGVEPLLLRIERSQLRWLGHLFRMPPGRLPREVFQACPTGRRPRGRPRTRWRDYVSRLAWERLGVPLEELEEVSGVREVWASLLRLLPQASHTGPGSSGWMKMDGWMDGDKNEMPGAESAQAMVLQRASKASEGSHCSKISVRRRVQKNFQGIKYTMEHSEDSHHQVEKIWHNSDITKEQDVQSKIDDKTRRKLVREAAKRPTATLKELQEFLASTGCVAVHVTTISSLLHMSGLWGRVARWKPYLSKKKHPSPGFILQKDI
ncbi:hypothetical protein L3Q82_024310 [Scortum barcoo]|uniref:Uncharacterized protein n=1 Tax=Scortum barcoo TaxID=214431 RepID=A0ACB8WVK4_9TELE|nr:hypothetical protein L3Q82_024310 [Scortum barcoo]